jgi:hypothetical protein
MSDLLPNAPREFRFAVGDLILGMQRELQFRHRVYERRVADKKMTKAQSDREIALVHAVIAMAQTLPIDRVFTVPAP